MYISKVIIKNFRNFKYLEVDLSQNVIILGENGVGKSNFLDALRLVLDPSRDRRLHADDFYREGPNDTTKPFGDREIEVNIQFTDFSNDKNLNCTIGKYLISKEGESPIAQISYRYAKKGTIPTAQEADSPESFDYELYGGTWESKKDIKIRDLHSHFNIKVIPALRDIESDMAIWRYSPLQLLLSQMNLADKDGFKKAANLVEEATQELQKIEDITELQKAIKETLEGMIENISSINPKVSLLPQDPAELQKELTIYIDENLKLNRSSLGLANVLYLTLLKLEIDRRENNHGDGKSSSLYQFTILAIEEPEAHLHPHLQRLVFRNFLKKRPPVLLSTHSPHIVSIANADSFVILKKGKMGEGTIAKSSARLRLEEWQPNWQTIKQDIERYLNATRGEMVFAKGVILVEGYSEVCLIPAFADKMKESGEITYSLDGAGISVCNVASAEFKFYLRFLQALGIPFAVITDGDSKTKIKNPKKKGEKTVQEVTGIQDGKKQGLDRVIELVTFINKQKYQQLRQDYVEKKFDQLPQQLQELGMFVNDWTLEVELITAGYQTEIVEAYQELGMSEEQTNNLLPFFKTLADSSKTKPEKDHAFYKIISLIERNVGKELLAQRLAAKVTADKIPAYIKQAITYIINQVASKPTAIDTSPKMEE